MCRNWAHVGNLNETDPCLSSHLDYHLIGDEKR